MTEDRFKEIVKSIPSTLKMRLDNIKTYLYYNRGEHTMENPIGSASVMVGSGFSKNADKGIDVAMLDWKELGTKFYKKLYGKEPTSLDLIYASPIKLATMVEAEFGRTVLDKMIQDSLPDDRVFPNDLYKDLLNLPWHDVFTTNYDRLLERTEMVDGMSRHYNVVTNKETLIYTSSPRIVKLHGSFPDIHPYIITEEDYRTYPQKYPEFVNTVRQSLIENLFCLIGFSGDDPNFLNWIGWLRDVMGRLSMPVYLIIFDKNIHGAQLQLFQRRNIQVVNLADLPGIKTYREAFEFLFKYLRDKEKYKESWNCLLSYDLNTDNDTKEFIVNASKIRNTYPGWIVLPEKYYRYFDDRIDAQNIYKTLQGITDNTLRINLLFEFDWQLTISLTPKIFDWYEGELEKIEINEDDNSILSKKVWLLISLLNIYRHKNKQQEYDSLQHKLKPYINDTSEETYSRYYNEVSLYYVAKLEYDEALKLIQDWQPIRTDFKTLIQKATILAECGQDKDANATLKQIIADINTQKLSNNLKSTPLTDSCIQQINNLLSIYDFKSYYKNNNKNIKRVIGFQSFVNNLKEKPKEFYNEVHDFGINSHTSNWNLDGGEFVPDYLNANRILTWFEESGYPFGHYIVSTEEKAMSSAISNIIKYEPFYGISSMVRTCNKNVLKKVLTRQTVNSLDRKTVDKIFMTYMQWTNCINKEYNKSRLQREFICIKLFAPLSAKASDVYVSATLGLMISDIERIRYDFEQKDFNEVYSCISRTGLNELITSLFTIPYFKRDSFKIIFPVLPSGKYLIESEVLNFIKNGLLNEDRNISNQAYERLYCIYNNLSDNQKSSIRRSVMKWRNVEQQTQEMLRSYNEFNYDESEKIKIGAPDKPCGRVCAMLT